MPEVVYQVILHVPEGIEMIDPEEHEQILEGVIDQARENGALSGVSHTTVTFEDVV